mmetsp:Transcript_1456/g.2552  ORF Transcript_1456/g.2552 Transcript_1456/m.2552 type:complete len:286 (+) Transcript_1456:375-1232(+)
MWAEYNEWLLLNTLVLLVQSALSLLLAFDLPYYLLHFRGLRLLSFALGLGYSAIFLLSAADWYYTVDLVKDKSSYDFFSVFQAMCLGYNLAAHWPVFTVNLFIVLREALNFIFPSLTNERNEALAPHDVDLAEKDLLWALNPFTWIDVVWEYVFGFDAEDYFVENPTDEGHFLPHLIDTDFAERYSFHRDACQTIFMTPAQPNAHKNTIIFLHGLGAAAADNVQFFEKVDLFRNCKLVFPQAPKTHLSTVADEFELTTAWFDREYELADLAPAKLDLSQIQHSVN